MILLSKITGWGLAEILDTAIDEFWVWLKHAQDVENEIAQQVKGK